jgi:ribose 5-phosphate isomerase A
MTIGLGTGSTVYYTILKLGELVRQGLHVEAIPTSKQTEELCRQLGIPLTSFAEHTRLDLVIDGADAVTPKLDLIKGGGGALLREKLVASSGKKFVVVADDSKMVPDFNCHSIPVEVVPFAWEVTSQRIVILGGQPTLRIRDGQTFVTDNMNFILDTIFTEVDNPIGLHQSLKSIVGVVETGLFVGMSDWVIIATNNGTKLYSRDSNV